MASLETLEANTKSGAWSGLIVQKTQKHHPDWKTTQESGFKQFSPRDPVAQAKYDATSPTWEGVASSDAAIARGDYSLDSAEANRDALRKTPQPPPIVPAAPPSNCVLQ